MAKATQPIGTAGKLPWRMIGWGTAAALLALPYAAGAPWTLSDYIFAAMLFGLAGLAFELAVRKGSGTYRAASAVALAAAFLTVWANGAVGMIGSEDNPYNLWFGGALAVALAGAIAARFEARGMAWAMAAAGIAQAAAGGFGLTMDFRGGLFSMAFAGLWLIAAALFRRAD